VKQFEAYLIAAAEVSTARAQQREAITTMTTLVGVAISAVLYFMVFRSLWLSIASFFLWSSIVNGLIRRLFTMEDERRRRENPQQEESLERVMELNRFRAQGSLSERFHPKVLESLDRCAALVLHIRRVVNDPTWLAKHSGEEWQRVIAQSLQAADATMSGAILTCAGGYRPKGMPRKVWKEQVDADPKAAGKVAALATYEQELSQLADALGATPSQALGSPIGLVLKNLAELRAAEEELDDLNANA
jgi:hypothetical protein